jgi:lipopolysaccharide biosynthesis protein
MQKIKPIAFYLPQYHPIPENDKFWGKGFTEWFNVTRGRPLFKGHYQPHLPADLGFYDLRLAELREEQANLAKAYGIYGFCYYHYWFNGKRLLDRPFNEVLKSNKPDFPFCLCWANENWTRRWDGKDEDIIVKQEYSEIDDRNHIRWLAEAFSDSRYIRVNGKPLFLVYRANKLKNPERTTSIWREEAMKLGIGELFLCRVESFYEEHHDPKSIGFDAAVEFQPDWSNLGPALKKGRKWDILRRLGLSEAAYGANKIFDYSDLVQRMLQKPVPSYLRFPCVTPGWDNTARRKENAVIFHNSTPEKFGLWVKGVADKMLENNDYGLLFVNAWNEWAEGNHLEPCSKWGTAYLEKLRQGINDANLSNS